MKLVLFLCFFLIFSPFAHGQVNELLNFNPDYETIDFAVEGTVRMSIFLINPTLEFYGRADQSEDFTDPLIPPISVTEAGLSVLSLPISIGPAQYLAEDITQMATGVSQSTDMLLNNYRVTVYGNHLYFVYGEIVDYTLTDMEIINLIEDEEIIDLISEKGLSEGIVYGGRMSFEDELVKKIMVYSDRWWAELNLKWELIQGEYFFPEKIIGEGHYERPISIELIFSDYVIR